MRRFLVVLCVLGGLIAGIPRAAVADSARPDPNVAGLQVALAAKGFYRGAIDGIRGPLTVSALRAFQRRARLAVTTVATGRTLAALGRLGRPRYGARTLRGGMVGLDVAALQFELRYHGFPIRGHGVFGGQTVRALARFQRYAGLPVDGVAGAATFRALRKAPPRASKLFFPLTSFSSAADAGRAVEITCPYGASVAAAAEGTVVFAGERPHGYGYTVVTISRTGLAILYAHLARFDVKRGESVVPGAFVGLAGWTGKRKTVTTLRIEVRLRGAQLDAYTAFFRH